MCVLWIIQKVVQSSDTASGGEKIECGKWQPPACGSKALNPSHQEGPSPSEITDRMQCCGAVLLEFVCNEIFCDARYVRRLNFERIEGL